MTTPRTAATADSRKDSIAELNVHHGRLNLSETWKLIRPYWFSEDRHKAWGLLALVIGLNLFLVYMNVLFTDWNRLFYNALEQKNYGEFWIQLGRFFVDRRVADHRLHHAAVLLDDAADALADVDHRQLPRRLARQAGVLPPGANAQRGQPRPADRR